MFCFLIGVVILAVGSSIVMICDAIEDHHNKNRRRIFDDDDLH